MSLFMDKPKLRVTVDNRAPPDDDIIFETLPVDDKRDRDRAIRSRIRDEEVTINRPFSKPAPRKRYQNPDFYIEKKDHPDENDTKKMEQVSKKLEEEKDLLPSEKLKRRQDRAKTFGMVWGEIITPESDLIQRYQSKTAEQKKSRIRSSALHIDGVTNFSTEKVFEYFKPYPPESLEWIDDDSCNIVFDKEKDCSLCFLQYLTSDYPEIHRVPDKKRKSSVSETENKEEGEEEEGEVDDDNVEEVLKIADENIYVFNQKKSKVEENFSGAITSIFRYGPVKVVEDRVIVLTCRYSVENDRKEKNAMSKSKFYQERGNPYFDNMTGIFTNSFKKRYLANRNGVPGFDEITIKPTRPAVFSRLGGPPKPNAEQDDESISDDDLDDLLKTVTDGALSDIDNPGRKPRERARKSRSRSPQGLFTREVSVSSDSSVDSFDDMLMSMRAGRRMKLYADDLDEKKERKRAKVEEKLRKTRKVASDRLSRRLASSGHSERGREIQPPKNLRIQMTNEYADGHIRKTIVSSRKGGKVKSSPGFTEDGFIDTRVLYQDDLEEAQKENSQVAKVKGSCDEVVTDRTDLEAVSSPEPDSNSELGEPPSPINSTDSPRSGVAVLNHPNVEIVSQSSNIPDELQHEVESSILHSHTELSEAISGTHPSPVVQATICQEIEATQGHMQLNMEPSSDMHSENVIEPLQEPVLKELDQSRKRKSDNPLDHKSSRDKGNILPSSRIIEDSTGSRKRSEATDSRQTRPDKSSDHRRSDPKSGNLESRSHKSRVDDSVRPKVRTDQYDRSRQSKPESRSQRNRPVESHSRYKNEENRAKLYDYASRNDDRHRASDKKLSRTEPGSRRRDDESRKPAAARTSGNSRHVVDQKRTKVDKRRTRSSSSGSDSGSESDSSSGSSGSSSSGSSGSSSSGSSGSGSSSGEE